MHKAEKNIPVAAASIIARARFLNKLAKMSDEYKLSFPKGASESVVEIGKTFVQKYKAEMLRKVAKLHFKTTKAVLEL